MARLSTFAAAAASTMVVAVALGSGGLAASPAAAAEGDTGALTPPAINWPHKGPFGTFDRAAVQRGLQVYREVCAACHGLKYVYYRDLTQIGYSDDQAKAFAAEAEIEDGPNEDGEMFTRARRLSDSFPAPFANANAARAANGGALPPDLSLIVKARHDGENYVHALLTGYAEPPAGFALMDGANYNPYFEGRQIAMPPPLMADAVSYADGTQATVDQMARDVVEFLSWAAEPTLETRHRLGFKVVVFLLLLAGLFYAVKRKVWADLH